MVVVLLKTGEIHEGVANSIIITLGENSSANLLASLFPWFFISSGNLFDIVVSLE
jgi:hypothetical protein